MIRDARIAKGLYRKLLALYPREFKDRFADSMEQTFQDLWNEKRHSKRELFSLVCWTFVETAFGIAKEHLALSSAGAMMKLINSTIIPSALTSLLFVLPFIGMEVVNRRDIYEDFPAMLFFVMWLNLFAISLILLPIVRGRREGSQGLPHSVPPQRNVLVSTPRAAAITSVAVFLAPVLLALLGSLGWIPLDRLLNGPNPEQPYLPGQIITLLTFSLPIAAGMIASGPVVRTLRAGGSLFAHPLNLIIVAFITAALGTGLVGIIIDQWPCFVGVPTCD
jgi:hypothetical protein